MRWELHGKCGIDIDDMICNFLLEKSLSAKVLINKEDFEFVDGFLVR